MTVIVFAGPSLPAADRAGLPGFDFRPPVRQGDVHRAALEAPSAIGIVDGYFEGVPSVWHKEILFALARGIPVAGAASMGALRAAELDAYGMAGIGAIYAAYRDGVLEDDDEVAVLHGPAETGHVAVTVPMVNVRATLDRLAAEGRLDAADAERIAARAKAVHYKDRDWPAIAAGEPDLARLLKANAADAKRADALALMAALAAGLPPPDPGLFDFVDTFTFRRGIEAWTANGTIPADDRQVLDELVLDPELLAALSAGARLERALSAPPPPEDPDRAALRAELDRLRRLHGLMTRSALDDWIAAEGLTPAGFEALVAAGARAAAVEAAAGSLAPFLIRAIRRAGHYARLRAAAGQREKALAAVPADAGPVPPVLMDWYAGRGGPADDPDALAADLGLADRRALYHILARHWRYAKLGQDR